GVGVLKVKGLFRKLRKLAVRYGGVIVFFDEADSLGSRGGSVGGQPGVQGHGFRAASQAGGNGANPASPFAGCHGFTYLSRDSQSMLLADVAASAAADP